MCENVYGAKIVRILFPHAAGPATPSTHCTRKACREPRARSVGTTGFSRFLAWGAGGHRDVSLAREGKNIWRLRTPFYCAAARERFRTAKTLSRLVVRWHLYDRGHPPHERRQATLRGRGWSGFSLIAARLRRALPGIRHLVLSRPPACERSRIRSHSPRICALN